MCLLADNNITLAEFKVLASSMTAQELAIKFKVTYGWLKKFTNSRGISTVKAKYTRGRNPALADNILKLHNQGKTAAEITIALGCFNHNVYAVLTDNGITPHKTRPYVKVKKPNAPKRVREEKARITSPKIEYYKQLIADGMFQINAANIADALIGLGGLFNTTPCGGLHLNPDTAARNVALNRGDD